MESYLEEKYRVIKEAFRENVIFTAQDVYDVFKDENKNSISWHLSKLTSNGYLRRMGRGKYMINVQGKEEPPVISNIAKKTLDILSETGFDYYLTGIDVLAKYLHHVPETYPVMLFVYKHSVEEVVNLLAQNMISAIDHAKGYNQEFFLQFNTRRDWVLIFPTESFAYQKDHIAEREKAFIDLYYEISRNQFPLAIQELARVYNNMLSSGALNKSKLIKTAYVRHIEAEIRFMVDGARMKKAAFQFVNALRGGDGHG